MGQAFTNGWVIYNILWSLKQQRSVKKKKKRPCSALAISDMQCIWFLLLLLVCFVEVVVVVWFYLFCFLFMIKFFLVCLLACLFFCRCVCSCCCCCCCCFFFFRLYANFQLTKCSIKDPQNGRGYVTRSLYSVITSLITSPLALPLEVDKLMPILFCWSRRRGLFRKDLKLLWYSKWCIARAKYKSNINHSKAHRNDLRSLYDVPKSDTLWHNGPTANSIWKNKKWTRQ